MSEPTKACNLTENEITVLLQHHGLYVASSDQHIERLNYLNRRLKAFKEVEVVFEKEISQKDGW